MDEITKPQRVSMPQVQVASHAAVENTTGESVQWAENPMAKSAKQVADDGAPEKPEAAPTAPTSTWWQTSPMKLMLGVAFLVIAALAIALGAVLSKPSSSSSAAAPVTVTPAPVVVAVSISLSVNMVTTQLAMGLRCDVGRLCSLPSSEVLLSGLELADGSVLPVDDNDPANADTGNACHARRLGAPGQAAVDASAGYAARQLPSASRDVTGVRMKVKVPKAQAEAAATRSGGSGAAAVEAAAAAAITNALAPAVSSGVTALSSTLSALIADPTTTLGLDPSSAGNVTALTDLIAVQAAVTVQEVVAQPTPSATPSPSTSSSPGASASTSATPSTTTSSFRTPTPTRTPTRTPSSTGSTSPTASNSKGADVPSASASSSTASKVDTTATASSSTSAKAGTSASSSATASNSIAARPATWQDDMLAQVNAMRAAASQAPLVICAPLQKAAQDYADLMSATNTFSHTGPDGSTPFQRMTAAGYSWSSAGENIAMGQSTVTAVMGDWYEEGCQNPAVACGHYQNIVSNSYKHVGFGYNATGTYWVQDFGTTLSGNCPGVSASPSPSKAAASASSSTAGTASSSQTATSSTTSTTSSSPTSSSSLSSSPSTSSTSTFSAGSSPSNTPSNTASTTSTVSSSPSPTGTGTGTPSTTPSRSASPSPTSTGTPSPSASPQAALRNMPPVFLGQGGQYVVAEGVAAGSTVGELAAVDADTAASALRYSLIVGPGLAVNAVTGVLTVTSSPSRANGNAIPFVANVTDGVNVVQASFTVVVVASSAMSTAGVSVDRFDGIGGHTYVSELKSQDIYKANTPTSTLVESTFDHSTSVVASGSGVRLRTLVAPPTTGDYTFYVYSADSSELRIGSNVQLSSLPVDPSAGLSSYWRCNDAYSWDGCSDPEIPRSTSPMSLVKGQWYVIEALLKVDGSWGGNERLAVAWQTPGGAVPVTGSTAGVIPASYLRPMTAIGDWTPPSAPSSLLVETVNSTGVTLSWASASDDVGVVSYKLWRDGVLLTTVPQPTSTESLVWYGTNTRVVRYVDTVTTGTRKYTVAAMDAANNVGPSISVAGVDASKAYDSIEAAISTGDPTLLNDPMPMIDRTMADIATAQVTQAAMVDAIYPPSSPVSVAYSLGNTAMMLINPTSDATQRVYPLIIANKCGRGWVSSPYNPCSDNTNTMAVIGTSPNGTRFAAFGDSPFQAGYTASMKRVMAWLLTGNAAASLATTSSSVFVGIGHSGFTDMRTWLVGNGVINASSQAVDCQTDTALRADKCLDANSDNVTDSIYSGAGKLPLLIIGSSMGNRDANSPVLAANVMVMIARAERERIPILFVSQDAWDPSSLTTQIVGGYLGFSASMDYWTGADCNYASSAWSTLRSDLTKTTSSKHVTLLRHLRARDWSTDFTGCETTVCPDSGPAKAYLASEFYAGARDLRTRLTDIDSAASVSLFDQPKDRYRTLKQVVLIGDLYRRYTRYDLQRTPGGRQQDFFAAYFADHMVLNTRTRNPAAPDLGSFQVKPLPPNVARFNETLTFDTRLSDFFTATGVYALPGQTFTIERLDNGTQALRFSINTLRQGSTQEMENFSRPKFLWTPAMNVPRGGAISVTNPFGGPLQLHIYAAPSLTTVTIRVTNVGHHPIWRGPPDTAAFTDGLAKGDYSWAELITPGFQVHSRMALMKDTLSGIWWPTAELLSNYTYTNFYQVSYNLAGFVGDGLNLTKEARAICLANSWTAANGMACDDKNRHSLNGMQHFNADQANCGFGCSGNPYDAWWAFSVIGWGDLHEMGHNLQSLSIYGKMGEASNNIFPVLGRTRWNEMYPSKFTVSGHQEQEQLWFEWLQNATVTADPTATLRNSIWFGSGDFAGIGQNDFKIGFLEQIIAYAGDSKAPGPVFGQNGWDIISLMYIWQRMVDYWKGDATRWDSGKALLGMSLYSKSEADGMAYEDKVLVGVSWLLKKDMRPMFDAWGVVYTPKVTAQMAANGLQNVTKRFYYKPVGPDGSTWWPTSAIGSVPMDRSMRWLPQVPFVYFYTPEDVKTLPARKPVVLTVAVGTNSGTATFMANGGVIRGCASVTLTPYNHITDADPQASTAATCRWVPPVGGTYVLNVTVDATQYSHLDPTAIPLTVTVTESPTAPLVTAISRPSALPGTDIQLTGSNFGYTSAVNINGVTADLNVDSATQLTVRVPAVSPSIANGLFEVATTTGYSTFSTAFTVLQPVTGIAVTTSAATLNFGQVLAATAVVTPSYATNPAYTWSSSNTTVATVNSATGVVVAGVAAGSATITAVTSDGGFTSSIAVTVVAVPITPVLRVEPTVYTVNVDRGATVRVTASALPAGATNPTLRWSSLNPSVAAVDATGVVTGVAEGTATLVVTADDGGASAKVNVRVMPPVTANDSADTFVGLVTGMEWSIDDGRSWTAYSSSNLPTVASLNVVVKVRNATVPSAVKDVTFTSGTTPTTVPLSQWQPGVAYVSDLSNSFYSTSNGWDGYGYDRGNGNDKPITVRTSAGVTSFAKGMGMHANGELSVRIGRKYAAFVAVVGNDQSANTDGSVRFSVLGDGVTKYSNPSVVYTTATVAGTIVVNVTGVDALTLKIDDSGNGNSNDAGCWGSAHLVPLVSNVTVSPMASTLLTGNTLAITPSVAAAAGVDARVTWMSTNPAVATVSSSGLVTGVSAGMVTIIASSVADPTVNATTVVSVSAPSVTSLSLPPTLALQTTGTTTGQLTASVRADAGASTTLTWASSNTAVATVSASGLVTAVGVGNAVVTAVSAGSRYSASTKVYVSASPAVAPTAPAIVSVAPGDASVIVTWSAPAYDGGAAITSYTATANPGSRSCTANGTSATSCTVTGLTNGQTYTFTVTATNSVGASAASAASASVTAAKVPGVPTGVTAAVQYANTILVSWTAPTDNGGSTITSYTVTASPSGQTCSTTSVSPATPALTCAVRGITGGQSTTFTVTASNAAGRSAASTASTAVIAFGAPGPATNVTAVIGDRAITVTWVPPTNNGGTAVTSYTATAIGAYGPTDATGNVIPTGSCTVSGATATSCTVTGLANGMWYGVIATASNAVATSVEAYADLPVMPMTVPGAMGPITAAPGTVAGTVVVSWTAPATGGTAVVQYKATASTGQTCSVSGTAGTPPVLQCTVYGLPSGSAVTFTVAARNVNGWGQASPATMATAA